MSRLHRAVTAVFAMSLVIWPLALGHAQTAREIARRSFPSVVLLVMEDHNGQPLLLGSGFFVGEATVATNLHVIEGASRGYAKIVGQKAKYDIEGIVAADARRDLALLKIRAAAPTLALGNSRGVAVGDEVYAVGNPQGLEGTFSQGIVSGIRQVDSDTLIQLTAPISPGSSGGPVLNIQGRVIGVAVASFRGGQNLNFAIPAFYLEPLLTASGPVVALGESTPLRRAKSMVDDLGGRATEGVVGSQFSWQSDFASGAYSFSLRNLLRQPVRGTRCLLVFYDEGGGPLDVDNPLSCINEIPPGLAKRVTGGVDSSVQRLAKRVEIRILDFKIAE